jgi:signal transduction histidine kinase
MVTLGIGIAMLAIRYARHLEARIRRQHETEVQHKHDLQRLSARLVRAQEEERRIIARDLHDEIGQVLMAIKLELAAVDGTVQPADPGGRSLQEARSMTDRVLQTIRDLSHVLHPAMLDDFGLPPTLNWHLRQFSERTGVRTQLVADSIEGRLSSECELCAYRVVQEALTNVAKHAQATSCRVYLQRLPYSLVITVEDDGRGMEMGRRLHADTSRGLGLMSMRERVSELGGTYRLESSVGKGTRLTVELPVPADIPVPVDRESGALGGSQAASLAR